MTFYRMVRLHIIFMALMLVPAWVAHGEESPQKHEVTVGQRAPSFTLKDQNGRDVSLDTLLKKGPVAVVFIRSVEWCVYCQLQTMQLQKNIKEIEAEGGQVVAITYDTQAKVKHFASRKKIAFPILSDPDSKTIAAYEMRAERGSGDQAGSAVHGTFIIDQNGIVRAKPYLTSFEERSVVDALVTTLRDAKQNQGGKKL